MAYPDWDAFCLRCIRQEVQTFAATTSNQNAQRRIPTLMFHYAFLVVWEASFGGWSLLQAVTNGFRASLNDKMLQTITNGCSRVAKRQICKFQRPDGASPFPYQMREQCRQRRQKIIRSPTEKEQN